MLLAADVGNTNITLGVFEEETLKFTARLATDAKLTGDQYAVAVKDILALNSVETFDIEDAVICSVVPSVTTALTAAISKLFSIVPLIIGPGVKTGLNIKIDNPAQLGADLVAGAVAALHEYTMPCVIIDMGTATTISVLDENGSFLGGSIAAGVRLTLKALTQNTAQLPEISISAPAKVIGTNTADCMRSGLVFGAASMLDGLLERIEEELCMSATVVATGGLSKEVIPLCKKDIIYNENLLLDGLRYIYEKNTQ